MQKIGHNSVTPSAKSERCTMNELTMFIYYFVELAIEDYNAPDTTTPYGAHLWKGALVQPEQIQGMSEDSVHP